MAHDYETGLVYNNVYPDVDRKSGLIIPKTLVKTEKRHKEVRAISGSEFKSIEKTGKRKRAMGR